MSNSEFAESLKVRTKNFALSIIRWAEDLSKTTTSEILKKQIIRSATSIGANYCAACRARSRSDFIAKMKIVVEEADETQYWLELLHELRLLDKERYDFLYIEAHQLVSIFIKSIQTAKDKN